VVGRVEVVELDAADLDVARSADALEAICRRFAVKGTEAQVERSS